MTTTTTAERAEADRRLARVRALMEAEGYDAIISGDSGDWLPPTGNVRYLSNFTVGNMVNVVGGTVIVVPLMEPPTLVVPQGPMGGFADWARATAWVDRVQSDPAGSLSGSLLVDVVTAVKESGLEYGRIGIAGKFEGSDGLASLLPHAEIVDAVIADGAGLPRNLIERVRRVKSPWEIERLRSAQRCADIAMRMFMQGVRVGRRHVEAAADADNAAIQSGAERALTIMNSGNSPWMWWHVQGDRRFVRNSIVSLETNANVNGYSAQLARTAILGRENKAQAQLREVANESIQAMVARIRPGVTGGDIWEAGIKPVRASGLAAWGRLGHGMGLSMDEGFAIVPGDDWVLEDHATVALHASVWNAETRESYLLGEQYLIVGGLPELLSSDLPSRDLVPGDTQ